MGFAYIAYCKGQSDSSGTSLNGDVALDINAGDLLVGIFKWEVDDTTPGCRSGVGENDFTFLATSDNASEIFTAIGYKIAAVNNDSATMEFTLAVARAFRSFQVLQFRPDSGETVTLVAGPSPAEIAGGYGPENSGDISPTGTDILVFGAIGSYSARYIYAIFDIGTVTATFTYASAYYTIAGYKFFDTPQTNIHLTADLDASSNYWTLDIAAFKSEAAGGGGVDTAKKRMSATHLLMPGFPMAILPD